MDIRVVTLPFSPSLRGFPEDALRKACSGREVIAEDHIFFEHGGVPYLTFVVQLGPDAPAGGKRRRPRGPDPMESLPVERRTLYLDLKRWRNERAGADGVPPFVILRNELLAAICRQAPATLAALKEIDGIGEKTAAKYGEEVLKLLPEGLTPVEEAGHGRESIEEESRP